VALVCILIWGTSLGFSRFAAKPHAFRRDDDTEGEYQISGYMGFGFAFGFCYYEASKPVCNKPVYFGLGIRRISFKI
jgi:hypothetical protein